MIHRDDYMKAKASVTFASQILAVMGVLILAASILSLPFPFVRKIWFEEYWGYYGILNSVCFLWISREMAGMSLAAAFAGLGILLYEQVLTWAGFYHLLLQDPSLDQKTIIFMAVSTLTSLILLGVFIFAIRAIFIAISFKNENLSEENKEKSEGKALSLHWVLQIILAVIYATLFYAITRISTLEPKPAISSLRLLGQILSLTVFFAIGNEVKRCLKNGRLTFPAAIRLMIHGTLFICFLQVILTHMPIHAVLNSSP